MKGLKQSVSGLCIYAVVELSHVPFLFLFFSFLFIDNLFSFDIRMILQVLN